MCVPWYLTYIIIYYHMLQIYCTRIIYYFRSLINHLTGADLRSWIVDHSAIVDHHRPAFTRDRRPPHRSTLTQTTVLATPATQALRRSRGAVRSVGCTMPPPLKIFFAPRASILAFTSAFDRQPLLSGTLCTSIKSLPPEFGGHRFTRLKKKLPASLFRIAHPKAGHSANAPPTAPPRDIPPAPRSVTPSVYPRQDTRPRRCQAQANKRTTHATKGGTRTAYEGYASDEHADDDDREHRACGDGRGVTRRPRRRCSPLAFRPHP